MVKKKILVVEDELIVAMDIKTSLAQLGYDVVATLSAAEEAYEFIQNASVDLVLVDIHLEGKMDGIELVEKINSLTRTPAIFLTANSDSKTFEKIRKVEPYGYIIKPFNNKELYSAIEIALERSDKECRDHQNRKWLSSILSSLGDAVVATDVDGTITYANAEMVNMLNLSQNEILGHYIADRICLYDAISKVALEGVYRAVIQGDMAEVLLIDTLLITSSGDTVMLKGKVTPLFNQQEKIDGIVMVLRNISDDLKVNRKLFNIEHSLNRTNDLVCILNDRFNAVFINEAFSKLTGKTLETLERTGGFFNLVSDADVSEDILNRLEMKRKFKSDVVIKTAYRNSVVVQLSAEPIVDNFGELTGYMLVAADKRQVVKLEQEKFQYAEKYDVLMKSIDKPVVIFSIDEMTQDVVVYDVNDELCDYLGMIKVELLANSPNSFIPAVEFNGLKQKLQSLKPGDRLTTSVNFMNADQQLKSNVVSLVCSFNGNLRTVVAIALDQHVHSGGLRQDVEMHGLVHDVNNMLSVIAGYIHILDYELKDVEVEKDYVKDICDANEKAMAMCRQILNHGKETIRPAVIDINRFIEGRSKLIRELLPDSIVLDINITNENLPVLINERQLEQILVNLLKNAGEAIDTEGTVSVGVEKVVADNDGYIEITVTDNGGGIDAKDISKIFDPYFSLKSEGEGTGLGLSMVKSIVENYNGTIRCFSNKGRTTFTVRFPEDDTSISCEIHEDFCE